MDKKILIFLTLLFILWNIFLYNQIQDLELKFNETNQIQDENFDYCNDYICKLEDKIDNLSEEFKEEIINLNSSLRQDYTYKLKNYTDKYIEKLEEKDKKYQQLKNEKGITRATYSEVKQFLKEDLTDEKEWTEKYDCSHFAADVVQNALNQGILACTVELEFEDGGHIIVAFPTLDEGIKYFEPQDDQEILGLKKGVEYCSLANWNCDWDSYILGIACSCCNQTLYNYFKRSQYLSQYEN